MANITQMADISQMIDTKEIVSQIVNNLTPQLAPVIPILKFGGVLAIIYIIIIIIKALLRIRESMNIAAIRADVSEIKETVLKRRGKK